MPGVQVAKVPETEEVSDEELPGPKRAELPADTEVSKLKSERIADILRRHNIKTCFKQYAKVLQVLHSFKDKISYQHFE